LEYNFLTKIKQKIYKYFAYNAFENDWSKLLSKQTLFFPLQTQLVFIFFSDSSIAQDHRK